MDNSIQSSIIYNAGLQFDKHYIKYKSYYMAINGCIPNLSSINPLHTEKAFTALWERFADHILQVHTCRWFKARKKD